jgi:hypothetical protein
MSATIMAGPKRSVPQRLKPEIKSGWYGTAEAVPLSKTAGVGIWGER